MKTFKTAAALHSYLEKNAVKLASVTVRPGESLADADRRLHAAAGRIDNGKPVVVVS